MKKKKKYILSTLLVSASLLSSVSLADELIPESSTENEVTVTTQTQTVVESITTITEQTEGVNAELAPVTEAEATTSEMTETVVGNEVGTVDNINIVAKNDTVHTYDAVAGSVEFHVEDGTAQSGDYTTIQFPEELELVRIPAQPIALKTDTDVEFASASFDKESNQIRIIYNTNVVGLNNIRGGFNFYVSLNLDVVKEVKDIQLVYTVNRKQEFNQTIHFNGIGTKHTPTFEKSSWQNTSKSGIINTVLTIGKDGSTYQNMVITDDIDANSEDNVSYDYTSFKAFVGTWVWSDIYGWQFNYESNITNDVTWLEKNSGDFKLALPDIANNHQVYIKYNLVYTNPVDTNETINNKAVLYSKDTQVSEWASYASIFDISGWITGDKPTIPVTPESPKETPSEEPSKPTDDITPKTESKEDQVSVKVAVNKESYVDNTKSSYEYQAILPQTGENNERFYLIGTGIVTITALTYGVYLKKRGE